MLFFLGKPNSGKSTVVDAIIEMLGGKDYVSALPTEKSWPLTGLTKPNCRMWINSDASKDLFPKIIKGEMFCKLADGAIESIGIKFISNAWMDKISQPGLICCNHLFAMEIDYEAYKRFALQIYFTFSQEMKLTGEWMSFHFLKRSQTLQSKTSLDNTWLMNLDACCLHALWLTTP